MLIFGECLKRNASFGLLSAVTETLQSTHFPKKSYVNLNKVNKKEKKPELSRGASHKKRSSRFLTVLDAVFRN